MAKRKRDLNDAAQKAKAIKSRKNGDAPSSPKADLTTPTTTTAKHQEQSEKKQNETTTATTAPNGTSSDPLTFQIITGSYERVLHGFTATIPSTLITPSTQDLSITELKNQPKVDFTDTFLFNAHTSAIRCLALTPPSQESSKVLLATGSTDERINIYSLSKTPPPLSKKNEPKLPTLHSTSISENTKNKEMGSLLHHSSTITALHFPTRSKLLSASEDSTIAITRTRDWEPLSTIKAPIPKAQGRPSGDTAAPGEVPAGINAFAVHPSQKLMLSVGRGEKCMRLWNLVTGKKAGVLTFTRDLLASVGSTRFDSGEAKSVVWEPREGEEFAVAFDRGVVVFGIDCVPKLTIFPTPRTKVHKLQYLPLPRASESTPTILLISTEDGRILLYNTSTSSSTTDSSKSSSSSSPEILAQIAGPAAGITSRIKDFDILPLPSTPNFLIITGSSDGTVRLWVLDTETLLSSSPPPSTSSLPPSSTKGAEKKKPAGEKDGFTAPKQVGRLVGMYATETRVTCLRAFEMAAARSAADDDDDEEEGKGVEDDGSSSEDE
ncbi:WD40 repeat-like protein [Periconia macrospinosa]|uniref:WD40 repeat-like protein n=1 Tax=Periconia macrospinosa TaxID=97972 RepID=A0A2V1DGM4_9PLEO|nr:WD40 repeat-like protein [Periconia macrospinosa]